MKRIFRPFVAAALAALVSLPAAAAGETPPRFSKDEQPLRQAVEDAAMCFHFAGEFGGDGSARDREVKREMAKVCKDDSQQRVMQAYRKNPLPAALSRGADARRDGQGAGADRGREGAAVRGGEDGAGVSLRDGLLFRAGRIVRRDLQPGAARLWIL